MRIINQKFINYSSTFSSKNPHIKEENKHYQRSQKRIFSFEKEKNRLFGKTFQNTVIFRIIECKPEFLELIEHSPANLPLKIPLLRGQNSSTLPKIQA